MNIETLVDRALLDNMVEQGYIRVTKHVTLPVSVYKYTEIAQYHGVWNQATRLCRGLVVHDDGTVLARPFSKFFNMGESFADFIALGEDVIVTDKVDGAMGAAWELDGQWYISTPGSPNSEQAAWGTDALREAVADGTFTPVDGVTPVFEIVYSGSKVVVHYDFTGLVLLAGVEMSTGRVIEASELGHMWTGRCVEVIEAATMLDVLALTARPNAEGVVVRTADGRSIKIKQEDYISLHRVLTGLTDRRIADLALHEYRHIDENTDSLEDFLPHIPEEFHDYVEFVSEEAFRRFNAEVEKYRKVWESVPSFETQAQRAAWVKSNIDPDFFHVAVTKEFRFGWRLQRKVFLAVVSSFPLEFYTDTVEA